MRLRVLVGLLLFVLAWPAAAQEREQIVRVPGPGGANLIATVLRPPGEARQPLVIINHGSPADGSRRATMERPRYATLSSWFVARGYVVVLPIRRGYGDSGGTWAEGYGRCESPDYFNAGLQSAADIQATIDYMRSQPYVAADRTIVVGQSAGGWAAIALSSRNPPGVSGMINFAGGRGGQQKMAGGDIGNCTPDALVDAAAKYGATARVPMLWIYAENDSFFEPALARRMAEAYDKAGGKATYLPLGPFGRDGHGLAGATNGASVWSPLVETFLSGLR
ncbi:alpha/beta hydrolase family protein [Reyranella massiliensis]|uniref:alpha/beta hydrolase family protein n=1 Tax=Reyranella massiliensis TaxID=445220 RepID=UPI0002EEACA5|nr:CocE/NonD family hydrolase [Reyranella massiliensis]